MGFLTKATPLSLSFFALLALSAQAAPIPVLDASAVAERQITTLGNLGVIQGLESDLGLVPPSDR
ncbi:hypothetical protein P691DRAFT_759372 [Macrolepiota fuliginosa MF-IS2]|uniref:Uncharacterized protein n=1 Tax=Macrolepiota fuliginosa MF-IS2 TaxID=1400762 RepID=A0A9P6C5A6_9AGAR|nr:hypothetical protein P691DRAFT_759372 [Macrolepiota fuliginosa MF-IS2]